MKQGLGIKFSYDKSLTGKKQTAAEDKRLKTEIAAMRAATKTRYDDERASINLPSDTALLRQVKSLAAQYYDVDLVIVVGIGGSNLGTMAVHEALLGKLHNELGKQRVYYADTIDSQKTSAINSLLDDALKHGKKVMINVVSKSGSTTETIANFEIFLKTLQERKATSSSVVVTTDENSPFWKLAEKSGFATLTLKKIVGGRYSVLSPVGLFPLAVLGVDVEELLQGAASMRERCLSDEIKNNPAALGAIAQYINYRRGRNISEMFIFATDFESFGKWWRQLLAESCGKEFDRSGKKRINTGITPTICIGSTDLHSIAQLALGGPQDKFTTFINVGKQPDTAVPVFNEFETLVPHLQGKKLNEIMDAIFVGTLLAYEKQQRPFCHIRLPSRSAYCLGQLLQLKMMETMYLGALLGVNPFDQPAVEHYKAETRLILAEK